MDWTQIATNFGSIVIPILGGIYVLYSITASRIDRMETFHREDLQRMDLKLDHMDTKWEAKWIHIDEKWERLFEKLLIQEQKNQR